MGHLENPEFIQQQQAYLEVQAELTYLQRQTRLVNANAGVAKKQQKLQSDVNMKTATLKGIGKQLAYLGINTSNLSPDNITERIAIISPIAGYITSAQWNVRHATTGTNGNSR